MEKPIDLVSSVCSAWANDLGAEDLAAFFTDDAVYHNIPFEPVSGRENIAANIASFIRPGPPGIERIEFRVINIAARVCSTVCSNLRAWNLEPGRKTIEHVVDGGDVDGVDKEILG